MGLENNSSKLLNSWTCPTGIGNHPSQVQSKQLPLKSIDTLLKGTLHELWIDPEYLFPRGMERSLTV
jgi:hypothetical protein